MSAETCPNLQFLATFLGPDVQYLDTKCWCLALNVVQACAPFTQVIENILNEYKAEQQNMLCPKGGVCNKSI